MFKKGDRVEFLFKGETTYGVVLRGGKKLKVVIDGGINIVEGPAGLFYYSNKELPKDPPNPMDNWSVKKYKAIEGNDSYCFSAIICYEDKPVLEVHNSGRGGPNIYRTLCEAKYMGDFEKVTKLWAKQFNSKYDFELDDLWVDWYVNHRPYGVTAEMYFKDKEF